MTVGLATAGPFNEFSPAGLTSVRINGFNNGTIDLSAFNWTFKLGVQGEHLNIYKGDGLKCLKWVSTSNPPKGKPLTWYKALVDAPPGDEPAGLDMLKMGKGMAWLNGEEIGSYWPRKAPKNVYKNAIAEVPCPAILVQAIWKHASELRGERRGSNRNLALKSENYRCMCFGCGGLPLC